MYRSIPTLILTFTFVFCLTKTYGQQNLKFEQLGVQDGLSHSWAKCVTIDSKGFLWVGTINGLNRYDGRSFKLFKADETEPGSLSDNFIQAIREDSKGNIWVGTYSGGINLFNKETQRFKVFRHHPKEAFGLSHDRIHTIFEDSRGSIWVGTEGGLDQFDVEKQQFRHFYETQNQQSPVITGPVLAITEDSEGKLWVGTGNGLYAIQLETSHIKKFNQLKNSPLGLSHSYVTSIYEDENGKLWVGTLGGGVNIFDPESETFTFIGYKENEPGGLSHNSVLCLSGNREGQLYVGTEGGGVNIIDLQSRKVDIYLPEANNPHSLNSNSIHSLHYDPETQITWIGTYHGGVNYFSPLSKPFKHYKNAANELNNSNVLCITEDKAGSLYVGTDGGGVNIISPDKNRVSYLMHNKNNAHGLLSNAVLSLLIDSMEDIWIGTFNGGLDYLERSSGEMRHYTHDPDNPNSLSGRDVSAIFEDSKGRLWIGTMKGGLNRFDPETETFRHFQHNPEEAGSIRDNFISHILECKNGNLLIQTGKSLEVFDPDSEKFTTFSYTYKVTTGMPITSLEDHLGNVWLGTREALFCFRHGSRKYIKFTEEDGLPSSNITGILEDKEGNLWISTMRGLVKFTDGVNLPIKPQFQLYTVEDGLQGNDFKDQACYRGKDGTLYFGGQNGLSAFNPEEIKRNPIAPPVVLTGFKLFNKEVPFGEDQPLKKPVHEAEEVTLSYQHNVFSFEFAALNFLLPEKNNYAYMMEGFEEDWNYVGTHNSATYTNLNPGTYTFKVKASNNDGIWNEQGATIDIRILPPWWSTSWFRILAISFIVIAIVAVFQLRLYQFKLRQKVLKRQVAEATLEIRKVNDLLEDRNKEIQNQNHVLVDKNQQLTDQNEELESQSRKIRILLKEIQELNEIKLRFFTNISHELRTPLTLILGPLENLLNRAKNNAGSQSEYAVMHRNAIKLLQLINQLLDFRKIESGNIQLKACQKDVVVFTREVYSSFCFLAEKKHIHYTFKAEPLNVALWFDPEKMEKIITNLLSNAFKYTPNGGAISVELGYKTESDKTQLEIIIRDNGRGIPENQIDHIFDLYYQAQNAASLEQAGTGIGLALIKQFVELHHGEVFVSSTEGLGTSFSVCFPLGMQHLSPLEIDTADISSNPLSQYTSFELESNFTEEDSPASQEKILWSFTEVDKPTLLVVEDNPEIRQYITAALSSSFNVIESPDGKDALEKAFEIVPDLIISDVMMPILDGFSMCEQLKTDERTSHIPVILLTAYSGEEKLQEGFSSGADDYVTKPFNINILQQKIKNIVRTRRNLMERFSQSTTLDAAKLTSNAADKKFLTKAIEIIEENISNSDFGVEVFSDHFNMSRRNLLRKIKSVTGLSVNEFVKNIRMKKSIALFHEAEMNISEVAYSVGFSDPKYFSKCFKEQFGKSPSEFVAELQKG